MPETQDVTSGTQDAHETDSQITRKTGQMDLGELEHVGSGAHAEETKSTGVTEQPLDQSATVELIEIPSICLAGTTENAEPGDTHTDENPKPEEVKQDNSKRIDD